ncbi:PREDICTED: auxin response factor 3-like [Nelumbo nucifera]|uniref:Auxin response factor n=1 Tax=Nelumbo nucifera TaxID=4432 RepID=A0A1U8A0F4_NELNU|nr:PREDICTED: auxin response factor 3-like [Nelumbo nucifera]
MGGVIDLNTVTDDDDDASAVVECGPASLSSPSSSSASVSASASPASASLCSSSSLPSAAGGAVCLELWHACAGPLISLPKKGSVVVYLPQGHLEHISEFPTTVFDLPPHVFCRVVDVKLHAEMATDEVYAQVSLVPEIEIEQKLRRGGMEADDEEEEIEVAAKPTTPHMFCKTLTASDTSTHGGFSVPRRAAEDCFPPLDYKQQRPSQELIAKDLHGVEWKFRHIYRGQPRRHLLTTGWSAFVNRKKLVSGDAVLFLRGDNGELRLGIRRAAQVKGSIPFPVLCSQNMNGGTLVAVANAVSSKSVFHVYYNPRATQSEFIIPLCKFLKSFDQPFSVGMKFKMRFETEDAAERRYTGLIAGISDIDPVRWPGSKWRSLLVRWDNVVETNRHNRVSPWEIEPSGSVSASSSLSAPGSKRTRMTLPSAMPDFPVPNGTGFSDFGESLRFQKVLQGQEIFGFTTPSDGLDVQNHHPSESRRCFPGSNSSGMAAIGSGIRVPHGNSDIPFIGIGFGESIGFHKVLQGQEIFPKPPYGRASLGHGSGGFGSDGVHISSSGSGWTSLIQGFSNHVQPSTSSVQVSSPSSVLMFQQASIQNSHTAYGFNNQKGEEGNYCRLFDGSQTSGWKVTSPSCHHTMEGLGGKSSIDKFQENNQLNTTKYVSAATSQTALKGNQELLPASRSGCRLFGFLLNEESQAANEEDVDTLITSHSTKNLNLEPTFVHSAEKQSHLKSPTLSKSVGKGCTKVNLLSAIRAMPFDVAMNYTSL